MSTARYLIGDTRDLLDTIPDGSVDLIVTSPPFLALRSYLPADHPDKHREIGSEATPADFLSTLLALTVEWRRKLAPHGSLCVELGDTYSGSGGGGGVRPVKASPDARSHRNMGEGVVAVSGGRGWPLAKSMCGIPTLYTWSLAYGRNLLRPEHTLDPWRIRNLLVWARPNPPVGALGDKFRPITVACTSPRRWFDLDAVRPPASANTHARTAKGVASRPSTGKAADDARRGGNFSTLDTIHATDGAPPLDWWSDVDDGPNGDRLWELPTHPYPGSHFATYPPELPARLVKAMCPMQVCRVCGEPRRRIVGEAHYVNPRTGKAPTVLHQREGERVGPGVNGRNTGGRGDSSAVRNARTLGWTDCGHGGDYRPGLVLDPFAGSGTTLAAATGAGRDAIGFDLDPRNADLARERVGMFLDIEKAVGA